MIELKRVNKTYNRRRKNAKHALKNISLKLEETGMVFILGESGSGKSTFLNIIGGLDNHDDGDLIIKDKNTKEFTQNDYDSYRNTMIGFIFQEYNVLNQFNVGENISLALELQGEKTDKNTVLKYLKMVGIEDKIKNKPNELSGGERQRVAIARALIKDPEIIMADEPTGALDSENSKQILDQLKKISKNRLVIVVSHDRELAYTYADRIIEFSDGKIINDISKQDDDKLKEFDYYITGDILTIKKGYELTKEDTSFINKHLSKNKTDLSIYKNKDGKVFRKTIQKDLKLNDDKYSQIESKLPFISRVRIALNSLNHKPIRLMIAILLSAISFTLFGLTSTLASYKNTKSMSESFKSHTFEYLSVGKNQNLNNLTESNKREIKFTDDDLKDLNNKFKTANFLGVFRNESYNITGLNYDRDPANNVKQFYPKVYTGFSVIEDRDLDLISGKLPSNKNEVVISNVIYQIFLELGYRDSKNNISTDVKTYEDIIDKNIYYNNQTLKIVGIVDTKGNINHLKDYYETSNLTERDFEVVIFDFFEKTLNLTLFVSNDFKINYLNNNSFSFENFTIPELKINNSGINIFEFGLTSKVKKDNIVYFDDRKEKINSNELLVNAQVIMNQETEFYYKFESYIEDYIYSLDTNTINELLLNNNFVLQDYSTNIENAIYLYLSNPYNVQLVDGTLHIDEIYELYLNDFIHDLDKYNIDIIFNFKKDNIAEFNKEIVGVYFEQGFIYDEFFNSHNYENKLYIDGEIEEELQLIKDGLYNKVVTLDVGNQDLIDYLSNEHYIDFEATNYVILNDLALKLTSIDDIIKERLMLVLYIAIGSALFASFLLGNFISTSISYKTNDIGVLRAIGAKSNDVRGIFLIETFFIAIINFVIAMFLSVTVVNLLNQEIMNTINMPIIILNFGILQTLLLFIVSLLVSMLSSLIPVTRVSRKRPNQAIKAKN